MLTESMRRKLIIASILTVCASSTPALITAGSAAAPPATCSPVTTKPVHAGNVPSPKRILGFPLGAREATDQEIGTYLSAVDRASDQVVTGTYAHSWQDRPLRYALVGSARTMRRLPQVRRDLAAIRDPGTPAARAAALIRSTPDVLWITANVHGNEPSGGDAVLQLLYDLSDRSDCVVRTILNNSLVGLIPTQNPDGRAADTRTNSYAFDMNRDWSAGTQPETSGKLDLLWKYPPQLYVDEHEMGGDGYFFPPDADPIYHETPNAAYDEISHLYGDANAAAFTAEGWRFETYRSGYDLFYQGYGDTVPTTQFGAAGMTFEQGDAVSYSARVRHQYTSALVSLFTGAKNRVRVLTDWRGIFAQAQREGQRCQLEKNATFNPGHQVLRKVPDIPVCGYFLRGNGSETRLVLRRLQRAHVQVERLSAPAAVPDYTPYGSSVARAVTLPRGTYWISMAQPQKHWVQAMLNEDTYVPFPYFYDLSGWSNPLLAGLDGGFTGTHLSLSAAPVSQLPAPRAEPLPKHLRVGVVDQRPQPDYEYQTTGWLQWRIGQDWQSSYTNLTPKQITASSLAKLDVLLVPDVDSQPTYEQLGGSGRAALRAWVQAGGRYVGWQGGTALAAALGLSSVSLSEPQASSPGALIAINSPHPHSYALWEDYDAQMSAGGAAVIASFPDHPFVSGFVTKANTLAGSAIEAVDRVGGGSVTVFSLEPNFRGYTDSTTQLLRDAILATPGATHSARPLSVENPTLLRFGHTSAQHRAHDTAGRD